MPKLLLYIVSCLLIVCPSIAAFIYQSASLEVPSSLSFTYLIGLGLMSYSYFVILTNYQSVFKNFSPKVFIAIALGIFMLMPPVLSKDVYLYILQGKLAINGILTYTDGDRNTMHSFVENIDPGWIGCPNHYGPAAMTLFTPAAFFSSDSILSNIVSMKVIYLLVALISGWIILKIFPKDTIINNNKRKQYLLFTFLNPIFLIQGLGQMHIDFLLLSFCLGMIYGLKYRKWIIAGICIGLMGATKFLLVVIFGGILVLFMIYEWVNNKPNWTGYLTGLLAIPFTVAFAYFFVWENPQTILYPLEYHKNGEPVKSVIELLSYLAIALSETPKAGSVVEYNEAIMHLKVNASMWISSVFGLLALLLAIPLSITMMNSKSDNAFFIGVAKILMIVFLVYSPQMHAWYFLLILPFLGFGIDKKFILVYVAITFGLANSYEIAHILDQNSVIRNVIMIIFSVLSVLSYFIYAGKFFNIKTIVNSIKDFFKRIRNSEVKNITIAKE